MQKIVPYLWFNNEAKKAAEFYASVFPGSRVKSVEKIQGTPSGDVDIVSFQVMGADFMAMSAGPLFKPNPSISFMVNFDPSRRKDAQGDLDQLWERLAGDGSPLMPLQEYPFSKRYGWIQDKYGISWQLILTDPDGDPRPDIVTSFMYVTDSGEVAEEATDFYLRVFKNSQRGQIVRYPVGMEPNKEGAIKFSDFQLLGQWFAVMDASSKQHDFAFNEAVSLMINCKDQDEIDYYWGFVAQPHPETTSPPYPSNSHSDDVTIRHTELKHGIQHTETKFQLSLLT